MKHIILLAIAAIFIFSSCDKAGHDHADHDHSDHDHAAHDHDAEGHVHGPDCKHDDSPNAHEAGHEVIQKGPNGGDLKAISSLGTLEYRLDEANSTMTINILANDAKTALNVSEAPQVVFVIDGAREAAPFTAAKLPASEFILKHPVFSKHLDVYIMVKLDGNDTPFNIPLPHHH